MNKYLCVLGVLKTSTGLCIKNDMLSWLNPIYNVLCIEQDPPGKLFEYPAIKYALRLSAESNEPVLYIHTKGASNPYTWYQKTIRKIWKREYSNVDNVKTMFEISKTVEKPLVLCLYTGITKATWFNAWVVNPAAAQITLDNIKYPTDCNRFYYEQQLFNDDKISVVGLYKNDCNDSDIMSQFIKHGEK